MKAKVLYFITENNCKIITRKIKDGVISIKNKKWPVDKVDTPHLIETGKIFKKPMRLYYIHHNLAAPLTLDFDSQSFKNTIDPGTYSELGKMGVLKQLLTPHTKGAADVMIWMIIGGIMGLLTGIIVQAANPIL